MSPRHDELKSGLSNTMDVAFRATALSRALERFTRYIINRDHGSAPRRSLAVRYPAQITEQPGHRKTHTFKWGHKLTAYPDSVPAGGSYE